jgi:hypothetical protein
MGWRGSGPERCWAESARVAGERWLCCASGGVPVRPESPLQLGRGVKMQNLDGSVSQGLGGGKEQPRALSLLVTRRVGTRRIVSWRGSASMNVPLLFTRRATESSAPRFVKPDIGLNESVHLAFVSTGCDEYGDRLWWVVGVDAEP